MYQPLNPMPVYLFLKVNIKKLHIQLEIDRSVEGGKRMAHFNGKMALDMKFPRLICLHNYFRIFVS